MEIGMNVEKPLTFEIEMMRQDITKQNKKRK